MATFRTVAPDVEPVAIGEVRQQLRIDHDGEDALLEGLIRAAREEVEASCGLALIAQSWRMTLDRLPASGRVPIHRSPVRAVTAVTVYGADGAATVLDTASYRVDREARPARVDFTEMPGPMAASNGIEIDFEAGFGETGAEVPDLLRRAMFLLVAHWYEFRASFDGRQQPVSFPPGYERLIAHYRARRL